MSSPGLRERKKQKTRWAIQEHALRLFAQQGYDETTVEQIAAAAEISPSTFFRYFKTKEDVVTQDQYDPLLVELFAEEPQDRTPLAAMRDIMRKVFAQMPPSEREKIAERTKLIMAVPALRARTYENMVGTIEMIAGMVGRRLGRKPDDLAVRIFAGAVVGALIAALLAWTERDCRDDLGEILDKTMAQLESGLSLD
jgi:AcrR family transcriptional regulator